MAKSSGHLLIKRLWVKIPVWSLWHCCCFLSKKLYSHCSTLPNCINGDLQLTTEIAHQLNINGYLVMTGEANVKLLSMSANKCGPGGTYSAHVRPTCRELASLQVDLPPLALRVWVMPRHPLVAASCYPVCACACLSICVSVCVCGMCYSVCA